MVGEDEVRDALTNVIDPELGLDFVELGLVYEIEVDGPRVGITFTLTTPACPIGPMVTEQMKEFVGELEGVEEVVPSMVFSPPWTPDMMSEDAKFAPRVTQNDSLPLRWSAIRSGAFGQVSMAESNGSPSAAQTSSSVSRGSATKSSYRNMAPPVTRSTRQSSIKRRRRTRSGGSSAVIPLRPYDLLRSEAHTARRSRRTSSVRTCQPASL